MAKPKLALIPAAQGSKFYSVLPSSGVGDFDFTRSGSATRINSQGLIETVANGVSRLNYPLIDGKVVGCPSHILEPQRTNLVTYSEDISQLASQSNITITDNQVISPDGTLNAASFIDNSTNGVHRAFTNYSSSIASGQLVSHSIFAKAKEHKWFQLSTGGNTNDQWANFDLENGVIGNSSSSANPIIENYGNGWYKCILFATTSTTNASLAGLITLTNNLDAISRSPSYSGGNGEGVYIFGLQIEQGSYPTSYIPTNGSSVTRSAETANGSGDASTFNDSEGVLMAEISALDNDGTVRSIAISGSVTNDVVRIYYDGVSNGLTAFVYDGAYQTVFTTVLNNITENNKIAFSYKLNQFKLFINGLQIGSTDLSGNSPNGLNTLNFDNGYGSEDLYGNTKQIQYYDSALTDSELEQLTSWVSFSDMANGQLYTIE